jgi:hypothetical protein
VERIRLKPTIAIWLLRSLSSSFALTSKFIVSATPVLTSSLTPNSFEISTLTETLGMYNAGQIIDSSL